METDSVDVVKQTQGSKVEAEKAAYVLKALELTEVEPDTSGDRPYILVGDTPKGVLNSLLRTRWNKEAPTGVSGFFLTHPDHPGVTLEVNWAEDAEEDELEEWGINEEESASIVQVC